MLACVLAFVHMPYAISHKATQKMRSGIYGVRVENKGTGERQAVAWSLNLHPHRHRGTTHRTALQVNCPHSCFSFSLATGNSVFFF